MNLEERLARLERRNRRLILGLMLVAIAAGVVVAAGMGAPKPVPLVLPSGKVFDGGIFAVDVEAMIDWIKSSFDKGNQSVAILRHANGSLFAISYHQRGTLDGTTLALHANKDPMVYVTYARGKRHGLLKTWNADGQRAFWCQYKKGKRHGFCCLFEADELKLVLECSWEKVESIHLVSRGKLLKSFANEEEARRDKEAQSALHDLDEIQSKLLANERQFKKMIKKEDLRARQNRVAVLNPRKRAAIQARMARRTAEEKAVMAGVRRGIGI